MGSSCAVAAVAVAVVLLFAATAVAVDKHCFDACFDQCVPRNEFWFCQFSCYDKCGSAGHVAGAGDLDCEHSCVLSLCGQLDPGSKMMVACRDTCRKNYASAGCRSGM